MHEEDRDLDCRDCLGPLTYTGEMWSRFDDGFIWRCDGCGLEDVVAFA